MVEIIQVKLETVEAFKSVRLRALKDSPFAFGSTFEKESKLTDEAWRQRAAERNGGRGITFLAWDGGQPCGIAAGFLDVEDATKTHLVSVWVDPAFRKAGVARSLMDGVIDWAASKGAKRLYLMVTSNNQTAMRFYQRRGFANTGRTEPYPNDAAIIEYEMAREL